VEAYHFTPEVEALVRGKSSSSVAADITYLMRTSPNHHRGLMAIVRLSEKTKSPQPPQLQYSVECYFDRAVRFKRDDTVVRVLYAQYLQRHKRTPEALAQLQAATEFARENALSHFNIGLTYFELGDYAHALEQAHKARALGLERPELEERLKAKGAWKDPAN
jgi:tetratricopeptide (TPR) repeat protein